MSRRVVAYVNGRAIWSENVPASPTPHPGWGGELVRGGPGAADLERAAQKRKAAKAKAGREV